jgi:ABC-type glycerol-3-phosphate transport system substrate-binding protein
MNIIIKTKKMKKAILAITIIATLASCGGSQTTDVVSDSEAVNIDTTNITDTLVGGGSSSHGQPIE